MSALQQTRRSPLVAAAGVASLMALAGCATGGNVRGDFSCSAPDGICAPSSTIDDRALALMSADEAEAGALPATSTAPRAIQARIRPGAGQAPRLGTGEPARTQERVLRIVFQPYIDDHGRLHEASAIHAVVASGEWQQGVLAQAPRRPATAAASFGESLTASLDRIDTPADVDAVDRRSPDPAAVAAARARKADPAASIKPDVASGLAPKPPARANRFEAEAEPIPSSPVKAATFPAIVPGEGD